MIESNNRQEPNYFSILTADVRYCKDISDSEKILYTEVTCLSNKYGYCYATNDYFAELYGISVRTVQRRLAHLQKHGFIKIIVERNDKKVVVSRKIYIKEMQNFNQNNSEKSNNFNGNIDTTPHDKSVMTPPDNIVTTPPDKSVVTPPDNIVAYNNTRDINNTSMNITSNNNTCIYPKVSQSNQSSSNNNVDGHDNDNDNDDTNTSNIEEDIKEKIGYKLALKKRPAAEPILIELLANIIAMYDHDLTVEDKTYPCNIVRSILDKLTTNHLLELVDKVKNMQYRVTNKKGYIQSMIFNMVLENEMTFNSNLQKFMGYIR